MYLTNGVFPVPPIVKLPTTITGISGLYDLTLFMIYYLLFLLVKYVNNNANG